MTNAVVDVTGGYYPSPVPHRLTINNGKPVVLGGPSRLMFRLQQHYRIVEAEGPGALWRVEIVGYYYALHDSDEKEVLLYHWHPRGRSPVGDPHLHLKQGAQVSRRDIRDAHLPTGEVPLSAFLRLLIQELGAHPNRPDWASVLDE